MPPASAALPTHTASTTGAVVAPSEENLVTSFGSPVLPSASTVAASLPLKALSTSSAPGSSTKPLSFFLATRDDEGVDLEGGRACWW